MEEQVQQAAEQADLIIAPKSVFADNIQDGAAFVDIFLVDEIAVRKTKKGTDYWTLTLKDRSGSIKAKVWEAGAFQGAVPARGSFVKVRAEASAYRDEVELSLKRVRVLDPRSESIDIADFVPVGPYDRYPRMKELREKIDSWISDPGLRAVCFHVCDNPALHMGMRDAPAASSMHQPYVGGLLDHVLSMMSVARALAAHYDTVDADLLVAACILHDIGKVRELRWDTSIGYTTEGQLVGHVTIGAEILCELKPIYWKAWENERTIWNERIRQHAPGLDDPDERIKNSCVKELDERKQWEEAFEKVGNVWLHLRHIVASHHGLRDWGAAKEPMSREAILFHEVDMIDSRMGGLDVFEKEPTDDDGFTGWLNTRFPKLWRP